MTTKQIAFTGLLFCLSLLVACSGNKKELTIPEGILPADSMIQLFADLHLVDAKIAEAGITDSATKANIPSYYRFVLDKYKLDTARFRKSFNFYLVHPHEMNDMYTKVLDELSKRQAENQK